MRSTFIPDQIISSLLGRGISHWEITGGYTGERRHMLLCILYRPQVVELKQVVGEVDKDAFMLIAEAHQALGYGFAPLPRSRG
jgi:uncharacterized membrane-anchored protein YitT (DUF2179 family)